MIKDLSDTIRNAEWSDLYVERAGVKCPRPRDRARAPPATWTLPRSFPECLTISSPYIPLSDKRHWRCAYPAARPPCMSLALSKCMPLCKSRTYAIVGRRDASKSCDSPHSTKRRSCWEEDFFFLSSSPPFIPHQHLALLECSIYTPQHVHHGPAFSHPYLPSPPILRMASTSDKQAYTNGEGLTRVLTRDYVPSLPAQGTIVAPGSPDKMGNGEKADEEDEYTPMTTSTVTQIPLHMRLIAFSFVLFFSTGAAFAESTIGPLKSTLLRELKINSECQL